MGIFDRFRGTTPGAPPEAQPLGTMTGATHRQIDKAAAQRDRFGRAIAQCTNPAKQAELTAQHEYWSKLAEMAQLQEGLE